jgi:hypothetical protein
MSVSLKKTIKRWSNPFKKKNAKGTEDANLLKACKSLEEEFNLSFNSVTTAASDLSLSPTSVEFDLPVSPEIYPKSVHWDIMTEIPPPTPVFKADQDTSAKYAYDYEEASPSAADKHGHIASDSSMSLERHSKSVPQWDMIIMTEIPPPSPVYKADQDTSAKHAYDYGEAIPSAAEKYGPDNATPDEKVNCGYGDTTTPDDKKAKHGYGDATPDDKTKHGCEDAIHSKQRNHNMYQQHRRDLHTLPGGVFLTMTQEPRRRPNRCGAEGGTTYLGDRPPRPPSSRSKSRHTYKLEQAAKKAKRDGSYGNYGNCRPQRVQSFPAIIDRSKFYYY